MAAQKGVRGVGRQKSLTFALPAETQEATRILSGKEGPPSDSVSPEIPVMAFFSGKMCCECQKDIISASWCVPRGVRSLV